MKTSKFDYELFHKDPLVQRRIINSQNFTYRIIIKVLDKYLSNTHSVLDIGCGVGTISFYLASKGKYITGLDVSRKAIDACRKSAKYLKLTNITSFKVEDFSNKKIRLSQNFDAVIMLEVIEHLKDDKKALLQIFNLLSRKGILILSTPSDNAPLKRMGLLEKFDKRVGHVRRYNIEELTRLCQSVGFKLIHIEETEGILRNFLFTNNGAGKLVRLIRYFLSDIVSYLDDVSVKLFGASDIFVILQKP